MAITELPLEVDVPYYEFSVELDDVEFKLEFRYNDRDDSWYLTIRDSDDALLRAGIRVVNDWYLLRLWNDGNEPDGSLSTREVDRTANARTTRA